MATPDRSRDLLQEDVQLLQEMVRDGRQVWIKRTSGAMVPGRVGFVSPDGYDAQVFFFDKSRPGKELTKVVDGRDLLDWQNEGGPLEEADEGQSTGVRRVQDQVHAMVKREEEQQPLRITDEVQHVEHHNGLPVLRSEDYQRMYNTDIRALGAHGAATFNFEGYVREDRPGYESGHGLYYKDALATNGILKGKNHKGVHVGTDGIVDYNESESNHRMRGPRDVGEYDIYIGVPTALQRELGVIVQFDSCKRADEMEDPEEVEDGYESQERMAERFGQEASSYIVMRLRFDPQKDRAAREKVTIIHNMIVRYIESGKPLDQLEGKVRQLEAELLRLRPEDVVRKYPRLGQ